MNRITAYITANGSIYTSEQTAKEAEAVEKLHDYFANKSANDIIRNIASFKDTRNKLREIMDSLDIYGLSVLERINNIIWHIETNRKVCGDTRILEDVLKSLKNWSKELEKVQE